jgi:hypothetical protein
MAFFAQNKAKLCKNWIITLVFEKNAIFFAENWKKWQKIVIITSTPGHSVSEAQRRKRNLLLEKRRQQTFFKDKYL